MKYLLTAAIFLTSCTTAYIPPAGIEEPMSKEEQREYLEQQRTDLWILTLIAITPGIVAVTK
jgi:hypothetical protein